MEGLRPRGQKTFVLVAALAGSGALAGTALAGGPHPDPPPKAPPPPPQAYHPPPPPPPAVVVAPPPPPVVHASVRKPVKRHIAKAKAKPTPTKQASDSGLGRAPLLLSGAPVPAASSGGTLAPALLIVAFGLLLALLAVGVSLMPAAAVPFALGLRLERSRQTIMLSGLAVGVACALVGLLTAVAGR